MPNNREWEKITDGPSAGGTWRLRVEGGWIYADRDEDLMSGSSVLVTDIDEAREEIEDLVSLLDLVADHHLRGHRMDPVLDHIEAEIGTKMEALVANRKAMIAQGSGDGTTEDD